MPELRLPEFIEETFDVSSDPLLILLAREGEYEEAYQTARQYTAGARQIIERSTIEQCEERAVRKPRSTRH